MGPWAWCERTGRRGTRCRPASVGSAPAAAGAMTGGLLAATRRRAGCSRRGSGSTSRCRPTPGRGEGRPLEDVEEGIVARVVGVVAVGVAGEELVDELNEQRLQGVADEARGPGVG